MIVQAAAIVTVAGAVAALVVAETRGRRVGAAVAKTVASTGFFVLALLRAQASSSYDRRVLLALGLCLLGDVLLLIPRAFTAGLASFLLGHVAFVAGFCAVLSPRDWPRLVAAALALAGGAAAVWLWPHLGRLRPAVVAYIAVISAMAWGAVAAAGRAGWTVGVAGALFYVSDLAVARDRFVIRRFASRAWGRPAYYLAQVLFALTLGRP